MGEVRKRWPRAFINNLYCTEGLHTSYQAGPRHGQGGEVTAAPAIRPKGLRGARWSETRTSPTTASGSADHAGITVSAGSSAVSGPVPPTFVGRVKMMIDALNFKQLHAT